MNHYNSVPVCAEIWCLGAVRVCGGGIACSKSEPRVEIIPH